MKVHPKDVEAIMARDGVSYLEARKRLKGVTGPERRLVGEPRSGSETSGVKERSREDGGVRVSAKASDLLGLVERTLGEARELREKARTGGNERLLKHFEGSVAALTIVLDRWERRKRQRSGHSNAEPSNGHPNNQ